MNHCGAQHAPVVRPHSLSSIFTARFRASPRTCAGPNAAAVDDEGVLLPGKLDKAQHAVVLLQDPHHAAHGQLYAHHVQLNVPVSPHVVLLHMQAVGVK